MEKKEGKSLKIFKTVAFALFGLALGAGLGFGMIALLGHCFEEFSFIAMLISVAVIIPLVYFMEIILHESGHLIAGLMTGYRFSSFRVLSLLLVKSEGRYSFKRFSIPGTLGQCLLIPPEKKEDGSYPYVFYNLGGILMNLSLASIGGLLVLANGLKGYFGVFSSALMLVGILEALENGIPLGALGVTNDAANLKACGNPRVRESLWKMLTINALQTEGRLLSDMPGDLFVVPTDEEMSDMWVSAEAVFVENLLMEQMKREEAAELIRHLLHTEGIKLIPVYEDLLRMDYMVLRILAGEEVTVSKKMKNDFKTYASFPSCLRSTYAYELIINENWKAAEKIKRKLEKVLSKYPFPTDKLVEPKYVELIDGRQKELSGTQA